MIRHNAQDRHPALAVTARDRVRCNRERTRPGELMMFSIEFLLFEYGL